MIKLITIRFTPALWEKSFFQIEKIQTKYKK